MRLFRTLADPFVIYLVPGGSVCLPLIHPTRAEMQVEDAAALARELQLLHVTKDFQQLVKAGGAESKGSAAGGRPRAPGSPWPLVFTNPPHTGGCLGCQFAQRALGTAVGYCSPCIHT
jgi:hypothetical protein